MKCWNNSCACYKLAIPYRCERYPEKRMIFECTVFKSEESFGKELLSEFRDNILYRIRLRKRKRIMATAHLEYTVWLLLLNDKITMSKGRELLGFKYMEQMREWYNGWRKWWIEYYETYQDCNIINKRCSVLAYDCAGYVGSACCAE